MTEPIGTRPTQRGSFAGTSSDQRSTAPTVESTEITSRLATRFRTARSWEDVFQAIQDVLAGALPVDGLFEWQQQRPQPLAGLSYPAAGLGQSLQRRLQEVAERCLQAGQLTVDESDSANRGRETGPSSGPRIVAVPIHLEPNRTSILLGLQTSRPMAESAPSLRLETALDVVRFQTETWAWQRQFAQADSERRQAAVLADLLGLLESCPDTVSAARVLVQEMRRHFQVDMAAFGLARHGQAPTRVLAVSTSRDGGSEQLSHELIGAVLDEARIRGELTCFPADDPGSRHALKAFEQLAGHAGHEAVVAHRIRSEDGSLEGAWLMCGSIRSAKHPRVLRFLQAAAPHLTGCFHLLSRSERGMLARLRDQVLQRTSQQQRPWFVLAALLVILACTVPLPQSLPADCELQPVARRFVAAPFDGQLESTLVEPGDMVSAGQLLARLDGRELRLELAGVEADLHRVSKERDAHMAAHRYTEAQLSRHELERLQARHDLLQSRSRNLEIRSPFDGLVISGDLEDVQGAPVEVGQSLFEIAPLDRMRVEVGIPEEDVALVSVGAPVQIRFEADPQRTWSGTLERIHPRSELKDDQHVFIGTVSLKNADGTLRPGIQGRTWIETPHRPFVWRWLRRPWNRFTLWLGW